MTGMLEGPSAEEDDILMPKVGVSGIPVRHTALLCACWGRHITVPSSFYKHTDEAFPVVMVDEALVTASVLKHLGANSAFAIEFGEK